MVALILLFACGDDFLKVCESDKDCVGSYECRQAPSAVETFLVCTLECDVDEDCPESDDEVVCVDGLCDPAASDD